MHIENIIIGKPLVDPSVLLSFNDNDWINNEFHKTTWDNERFLPKLLVKHGFASSNSEIKRNRPDLFKTLDKLDFMEIKIGKKKCWIIVGK